MKATTTFPDKIVAAIRDGRILGIRAGTMRIASSVSGLWLSKAAYSCARRLSNN